MLIHKTMKMPTSCLSCWIAPTCEVWVREKSKYKGYDNRLDECPLEEVKHGHWIEIDRGLLWQCSECEHYSISGGDYCDWCGAKMDENEWEEPEINPCRGCVDYDGQGGCKSNGGCGAEMDEVEDGV